MIKTLFFAAMLAWAKLWSGEAATEPVGEDQDMYYAPADAEEASATANAGPSSSQASFYSRAELKAFSWGKPGIALLGVDVFLGEQYLGKTPLLLSEFLVSKPGYVLTASARGFEEALRPRLVVPRDGEIRVALLDQGAASWYSTPAWIVGLGLLTAAVVAYSGDHNTLGTTLLGSGVGLVTLVQSIVHFLHLPVLRKNVQAYNDQAGAAP